MGGNETAGLGTPPWLGGPVRPAASYRDRQVLFTPQWREETHALQDLGILLSLLQTPSRVLPGGMLGWAGDRLETGCI